MTASDVNWLAGVLARECGHCLSAWTVVVFLVDAVVTVLDLSLMSAGRCSGWRVQGTAAGAPQCKAPHSSLKGLHTAPHPGTGQNTPKLPAQHLGFSPFHVRCQYPTLSLEDTPTAFPKRILI